MSVVITGAGVVSPLGTGIREFFENLKNKKSGLGTLENFSNETYPVRHAGEAKEKGKVIRTTFHEDRKSIFMQIAMAELFSENRLNSKTIPVAKRHLVVGSGIDHFDLPGYVNDPLPDSWGQYRKSAYSTAKKLALQYELGGVVSVNVSACVASTQALGQAYRMVKKDKESIVISGGFDSMLSPLHYMGFYKLGALSEWPGEAKGACRPFDKERQGIVLGEGAVAYLIQDSTYAEKQTILAELSGYGTTMDAYMVTDPDPEGKALAAAALKAINEAGITPDQIDCVHLHGTGTYKNALAETAAMRRIFADRYTEIPVFSLKAQIGHLIGACGAMEILGVIYSLQENKVPPTLNYETPDPEVPLRVITGEALEMPIRYVLKLNSAFGGQNTAWVVKKYEA